MTKRNQDFDMHIGESKTLFIKLDNEDGTPFDPAGSTFEWWLAKTSHSPQILKKEIGTGLFVVPGGVNIVLESADTYDLKPELYYHELKIYLGSTGVSVSTVGTAILRHALDMRELPEQLLAEPDVRNVVIPRPPSDPADVVRVSISNLAGSVPVGTTKISIKSRA